MTRKKAARYLRYSSDGQSQHSIQRQDVATAHWAQYQDVMIVDTFIDEGYSARTFDRPDVKELFEFIRKNQRAIDYLIVSDLTRFSRNTGDALNMAKKIQFTYNIRIVSATRGSIYDCSDPSSYMMMLLEFGLGETENIKRQNDINSGIYAAKAKEGRWIQGGPAPYGYRKEGIGKERRLVVNEAEAAIVRYIYDAHLRNTPHYIIVQRARELGYNKKGNSRILEIIKNPLYAGYLEVKPWKDLPGGMFPGIHEAIIDFDTWKKAQEKFVADPKPRTRIDDDIPLRGFLRCHCGKHLTGAASRGRHGDYFYYYKCQVTGHNNYSAKEAHRKLDEMLGYLSLPENMVLTIRENTDRMFNERIKEVQKQLQQKKRERDQCEERLLSVEEKFINNQMQPETYQRWYRDITEKRAQLTAEIEKLSRDQGELYFIVQRNLDQLTDLQALYARVKTVEKQQLLGMVFDNRLYLRDKTYRTPYIMQPFAHNELILKEKQLLIIDKSQKNRIEILSGGGHRPPIEPLIDLLAFVQSLRVA